MMHRLRIPLVAFALILLLPLTAAAQETLVPGRNVFRAANGTASTPTRTYEADRCLGSFRKTLGEEGFAAGCVERWSFDSTRIRTTVPIRFADDLTLERLSARRLSIYDSTNPTWLDIYNTRTDGSNYERLEIGWADSLLTIGTTAAGTGTVRDFDLQRGGSTKIRLNSTDIRAFDDIIFNSDSAFDIGATASGRPRNLHVALSGNYGEDVSVARDLNSARNINITSAGYFRSSIYGTKIAMPADGLVTLLNNASTDFSRLQFGGVTSAFPAVKRSGTQIHFRLADDSAYTGIVASEIGVGVSTLAASVHVETVGGASIRLGRTGFGNYMQFDVDGTNGTIRSQGAINIQTGGGTNRWQVDSAGALISFGATTNTGAAQEIFLSNAKYLRGANAANTTALSLIGVNASDQVVLSNSGNDIRWGVPLVALGGGAAPTFGTIGGSGPTTAAQNSWMRVIDSAGNPFWVPVWK